MIPLVGTRNEMALERDRLEGVVTGVFESQGVQVAYKFGACMELPRACLVAGQIAETAEFFSYGTNDLTQTTYGYSRDDAEGKFLGEYLEQKILPDNPFASIDREGVGELVRLGIERGRKQRPNLEVGICGEQGGDPASVAFCHQVGMNYVSCAPGRVPIARLAAAQAALGYDLGHTPFGHAGEYALGSCLSTGFRHNEQSVRVVELLEKDGQGLNLTPEVRDGILKHSKLRESIAAEGWGIARTLEGQIVKIADSLAYLNHDIDDAIRAGVIDRKSVV